MKLRQYQAEAVSATLAHFRSSLDPACIVLPTGAGKSVVIAELARLARGRVLVLAHVKELCEQNHAKYQAVSGSTAGLYSAGLARRESAERVTFATVQSVAANLAAFEQAYSLLVIDECHRLAPAVELATETGENEATQYGRVLAGLRRKNHKLKQLGLTATPYRLGLGWIYRTHYRGVVRAEESRPFERCIFEVSLRRLVTEGFLATPIVLDAPVAQYDFGALWPRPFSDEAPASVNELLVRSESVTRAIIEQVTERAEREGRQGVMIFAASVAHARQIAGYLPPGQFALVLGETEAHERDRLVLEFRRKRLRYLVNVGVLTTGFDAPHVDLVAVLRPTQSVSLFQQIAGRGLRLAEGKSDCLIIDYAGNGFEIYSPEVGGPKPTSDSQVVLVNCPRCGFENEFWGQVDSDGHVVEHYGRRCQHWLDSPSGSGSRCDYRFRFKECEGCSAENDIAARTCHSCGVALVDPDEKLREALQLKAARVLRVAHVEFIVQENSLLVQYHDEDGHGERERFDFDNPGQRAVFNAVFGRRLASGRRPLQFERADQAARLGGLLPRPDFVVFRRHRVRQGRGTYFRVVLRVFDYQGRFRKAAS